MNNFKKWLKFSIQNVQKTEPLSTLTLFLLNPPEATNIYMDKFQLTLVKDLDYLCNKDTCMYLTNILFIWKRPLCGPFPNFTLQTRLFFLQVLQRECRMQHKARHRVRFYCYRCMLLWQGAVVIVTKLQKAMDQSSRTSTRLKIFSRKKVYKIEMQQKCMKICFFFYVSLFSL